MISIIIPSCTNSHLDRLLTSIEESSPGFNSPVIIGDNGLSEDFRSQLTCPSLVFVPIPEPFNFARAINACIAVTDPTTDILILNDDTAITSLNFLEEITRLLSKPKTRRYGIVSLRLSAGVAGNREQMADIAADEVVLTRRSVCFVAAVIRRAVLDQIGGLDEAFIGYGFDDTDFCRRAVEAGWLLGVTGAASVQHGFAPLEMSSTFRRKHGFDGHSNLYEQNHNLFKAKWGDGPQLGDYDSMPIVCDDSEEPLGAPPIVLGPREFRTREQFTEQAPIPATIQDLARDTDIEADAELLWAITVLTEPKILIELGTREGISTHVLALAAHQSFVQLSSEVLIITLDPDPTCQDYIKDLRCEFYPMKAEDWLAGLPDEKREYLKADMLFIDTDPHDYQQTMMWLDTWIPQMLKPGGCVLFHDVVSNRPEIQVRAAVEAWVKDHPDWEWIVFSVPEKEYKWAQGGLGLLWAP